ncbi:hypothetical protein BC008_08460 [Mastigocoleus testarum BC008]|uniref:S-layer family protein n=1 Tax=Mastigocoleus testarum BC008 TaxID=371196 RepID=A0A0V7ZC03_9CYAN|nr:hypothetical protein BC008_08460 [Mastigocoleus testarum BC008]
MGRPVFGLRVPDGKSLLLVGGDIAINGGGERFRAGLHARGGRLELAAVGSDAKVGLSVDGNNLSLSFPDDIARTDIYLDNRTDINARAGAGGSIAVNTRNLNLTQGSVIVTGISSKSSSFDSKAGDIQIDTTGIISLKNISFISNSINGGTGDAGDINIKTHSLFLDNNSFIASSNRRGNGNAGNLIVTADNTVSVRGGSFLASNTFEQGNAGNISINVRNLVLFDGVSGPERLFTSSGIYSNVQRRAQGNSGEVNITAKSVSFTNGAGIFTNIFGLGNAGNININAQNRVSFDGVGPSGRRSGAFSDIMEEKSEGRGADINIITGSLFLKNGALLSTNTEGKGDAGNVNIKARDTVSLNAGSIFSDVEQGAKGQGGDINITSGSLFVTDGAQLIAATRGQGDAGRVNINSRDTAVFDGIGSDGFSSGAFSAVGESATGHGSGININTNILSVTNGAVLNASTAGEGKAGSITVNSKTLEVKNNGRLRTTTSSNFDAGDITLNVKEKINVSGTESGIFANTTINSNGKGGSIIIDPQNVTIRDGAKISVDSQGEGISGDIQLVAGLLTLDKGTISAETRSNTGGNITLKLKDLLLLRNSSQISSTAGNQQFGGDGGNINIDTPFIVASPQGNNDITANAFSGRGGNINIATQGIFGLSPRSREELQSLLNTNNPADLDPGNLPSSDVTAISQQNPSLSGQISINNLFESSRGTEELPTDVVDAASLINRNICIASGQRSQFFITGKGGLPPSPYNLFDPNSTWEDWSVTKEREISKPKPKTKPTQTKNQLSKPIEQNKNEQLNPIVQAQDWVLDGNGNVVLTSKPVKVTQQGTWLHQEDCLRLGKKKS